MNNSSYISRLTEIMSKVLYSTNDVTHQLHRECLKYNQAYWSNKYEKDFYPMGDDFLAEDWDNLIILDACRFDKFQKVCDIEGKLEYRTSRGSMSEQFIRGNFKEKRLNDTVYISANFWFQKIKEEINAGIHRFIPVERDAFDGITSHPKTTTDKAIQTNKNYPNKRLICHYLQPHQPYFNHDGESLQLPGKHSFQINEKNLDRERIVDAYQDSLLFTLDHVKRLLRDLRGKTVITSDHGELLGDRVRPIPIKLYSHPRNLYIEKLLKVPWLTIEDGTRKNIIQGEIKYDDNICTSDIDSQLEALGYL